MPLIYLMVPLLFGRPSVPTWLGFSTPVLPSWVYSCFPSPTLPAAEPSLSVGDTGSPEHSERTNTNKHLQPRGLGGEDRCWRVGGLSCSGYDEGSFAMRLAHRVRAEKSEPRQTVRCLQRHLQSQDKLTKHLSMALIFIYISCLGGRMWFQELEPQVWSKRLRRRKEAVYKGTAALGSLAGWCSTPYQIVNRTSYGDCKY